jgi:hypothetical protein
MKYVDKQITKLFFEIHGGEIRNDFPRLSRSIEKNQQVQLCLVYEKAVLVASAQLGLYDSQKISYRKSSTELISKLKELLSELSKKNFQGIEFLVPIFLGWNMDMKSPFIYLSKELFEEVEEAFKEAGFSLRKAKGIYNKDYLSRVSGEIVQLMPLSEKIHFIQTNYEQILKEIGEISPELSTDLSYSIDAEKNFSLLFGVIFYLLIASLWWESLSSGSPIKLLILLGPAMIIGMWVANFFAFIGKKLGIRYFLRFGDLDPFGSAEWLYFVSIMILVLIAIL